MLLRLLQALGTAAGCNNTELYLPIANFLKLLHDLSGYKAKLHFLGRHDAALAMQYQHMLQGLFGIGLGCS